MSESSGKPHSTDDLAQEFKNLTMPHRRRESNQTHKSPDDLRLPPIPKSFLDAILETIAKSIEQALAGTITRCVGESVKHGLRPLTEEIALLRTAIEYDWDVNGQRRRRNPRREDKNVEE